jgi:hypothetical protein
MQMLRLPSPPKSGEEIAMRFGSGFKVLLLAAIVPVLAACAGTYGYPDAAYGNYPYDAYGYDAYASPGYYGYPYYFGGPAFVGIGRFHHGFHHGFRHDGFHGGFGHGGFHGGGFHGGRSGGHR